MDNDEDKKGLKRWLAPAIFGAILLALAAGIWWVSQQVGGTRRSAPAIQTITLQPPPPPPPPPKPPEPKPEPDKTIDQPKPVDQPQDAPRQLTIAGPAQAGGDAFGLQAGTGGGGTVLGSPTGLATPGGSFGDASYRRYMSSTLQQALQSDSRVNRLVFSAEILVNVDRSGRVTNVAIARSSGTQRTDQLIIAVLEGTRLDEPPSPAMRFPQRATVRGRKT